MEPQSIAHYRITGKLGEGGMGVVYRALDTKLDREVAVKVLPAEVAQAPDRLARFEREAKTLASLNHPNIAAIYGVENAALVMELVEGSTLAERLASGALPAEEAIVIARQIAEALEAAHDKGIVHRDLKPANVKITPDGTVKLLDFGLAKAMETSKQIALDPVNSPTVVNASIPGVIMGTAGYMSPEQAKGQPVDKRADIWAFGVVLFEMLSGRQLFDSGTVAEAIADVLRADIDLNRLPSETPQAVRRLLGRCLDRNVKMRLRDIGEARVVLHTPQETPGSPAVAAAMVVRQRSIWPWAIAVVLAAAAPLAWFLKPQKEMPLLQLELLPPQGVSMGPVGWGQLQVSPDGTMIVFQARDREGKEKLFLRTLSSGTAIALPGTEEGRVPYWSPDSRQIAFLANGRLKRLELNGNQVIDICEAATGVYVMWHGDGNIYVSTAEHVLRKVRANGGALSLVFPADQQSSMMGGSPATIPGENTFIYQLLAPGSNIVQMSGDGKVHAKLLPTGEIEGAPASFAPNPAGAGWLLFHSNFQLTAMAFDPRSGKLRGDPAIVAYDTPRGPSWSASNNGVLAYRKRGWGADRKLTWLDRNGTQGGSVAEQGNVYTARIAPDQKSVSFTRNDGNGPHVYVYDILRQTTARASVAGANGYSVWMPDGRSLVYWVPKTGVAHQGLQGAGGERLIDKQHGDSRPTGVSPDGKWVLSSEFRVGSMRMVMIPIEGGKTIRLGEQPMHHGSFSPDGRWLLFSALMNGRWDVYVMPVPQEVLGKASGGTSSRFAQVQVSPAGGLQPMWRSDGKEIFYIAPSGMLMAVPVDGSANGVRPGAPVPLFATTLASLPEFQREYDASADGKRFLIPLQAAGTQSEVPITVVFNWPKLLEKK